MDNKSSMSILQLIKESKKLIQVVNSKYTKKYGVFTYNGKSTNKIVKIPVNTLMNKHDRYEMKICEIRSKNKNLVIACECLNIITNTGKTPILYNNDSYFEQLGEFIVDVKTPLPDIIVFKGNDEFEITIQLLDK